jgi:hypothetical protein
LSGRIPSELKELSNLTTVYLMDNQFEGEFPDLSNLSLLNDLNIRSNNFRFIDLQSQFLLYKAKLGNRFDYRTQAKTDTQKNVNALIIGSTTLTMCEDNRFTSNDTFQWYKDNTLIPGATSRQYTLTNLQAADSGLYTCKSYHNSNPDMSPLVLEREPITLNVTNCTPLTGAIKVMN